MQPLIKCWWLLALCGVIDAIISVTYFEHAELGFHALKAVVLQGEIGVAAGACTIAAGIWSFGKAQSWLLALNGLACGALGLIFTSWKGPLAFRTVALLIVVMALSLAIFAWTTALTLPRQGADTWLLKLAGAASVGFALAFVAMGFGWIKLDSRSPAQTLLWLGSYFSFSAICMLALGLRLASLRVSIHRSAGGALPAG